MNRILQIIKWKLMSFLMLSFRIVPINNTKVLFLSYYGNSFNDNPKAISNKLETDNKLDIVWAFSDDREVPGIRTVNMSTISYIYELATAKIWIDNCRKPDWVRKRKKQYYIQTWHGNVGVYKKIEGAAEDKLDKDYIKRARRDSKYTDLMLSGSSFFTEIIRRDFWYNGEVLECGSPRLDKMLNSDEKSRESIKEELGIGLDKKILLYVPTFRQDYRTDCYDLDGERIVERLNEITNKEWIVLSKLHPNCVAMGITLTGKSIKDVSYYPDVYKLIDVSDIIVTDFSSVCFEAGLINKPVFQFITDMDEYENERGLYFNVKELPFPLATSNSELLTILEDFDYKGYINNLRRFNESIQVKESGHATDDVVERIKKELKCLS